MSYKFNTGNPVGPNGSADARDLVDNAQVADRLITSAELTVPDRLGVQRRTWAGIQQAVVNYVNRGEWVTATAYQVNDIWRDGPTGAFYLVLADYTSGASAAADITSGNVVVHQPKDWVVSVATIADLRNIEPAFDGQQFLVAGSGAFEYVPSDTTSADNGFSVVVSVGGARYKLTDLSGLWLKTKFNYGGLAIGPKPFGNTGDKWPSDFSLRDAATVSRDLIGLTNCHAFSDKTVIDQVTDYGGYGTFDATTTLAGGHMHDHVFSFQDRTIYEGSGTLDKQTGVYSRPEHRGTGTIKNRYGIHIYDTVVTNGGSVNDQIGVFIDNLSSAGNNVALNMLQSVGFAIYASGGARSYHEGSFSIGTGAEGPSAPAKLVVGRTGLDPRFVADVTETQAVLGSAGDFPIGFVCNGDIRMEIGNSSSQYVLRPAADNAQSLGDVTKRWAALYAASGTINTSDEREKEQQRVLTDKEKSAAIELKSAIKAFKWKESVSKKGDDARWHFGVMAQEVERIFERNGLNAHEYGMFCYDEWEAETDDDGNVIKDSGNRYGVRYDQLLAFVISVL